MAWYWQTLSHLHAGSNLEVMVKTLQTKIEELQKQSKNDK
jgi:hypothetical protein